MRTSALDMNTSNVFGSW